MKYLTPIAFIACTAIAIKNLGWPDYGGWSALGGGLNAFIAGALAGQWAAYRHADRLIDRAIKDL